MSGGGNLEDVFQSFCAFGGGLKDTQALMDGGKFNKFCRDMKLLDKKLTAIDVDIMFAQVKQKSERKINFDQFMAALRLIAEKKYHPERDPMPLLEAKILEGKGPSVSGTTYNTWKQIWNLHQTRYFKAQFELEMAHMATLRNRAVRNGTAPQTRSLRDRVLKSRPQMCRVNHSKKSLKTEAVDRMTDTSKYTGTHRERFDSVGKGRGADGRDSNAKGHGSSPSLVSAQTGYVGGYKNEGTYHTPSPKLKKKDSSAASSVTDRLTDTSKYTGSHKHRFDETGRGKGIAGRDLPVKGHGMSHGSVGSQASYVSGYRNEGSYGKK